MWNEDRYRSYGRNFTENYLAFVVLSPVVLKPINAKN